MADSAQAFENASAINSQEVLSPWWRRASLLTAAIGFAVLILITSLVYRDAPPIPEKVVSTNGIVVFTSQEIVAGQQVFLKYGLMDNGSIWGHGALLGPDFSASYLHSLALHYANALSVERYQKTLTELTAAQRAGLEAEVRLELKSNRYDANTKILAVNPAFQDWFIKQPSIWVHYFSDPALNGGLRVKAISDPTELKNLSAFVAWTAWASVTNRPESKNTYTNNFPFDALAGNTAPADALLWSALSLIFLLGGIATVLLAFGKFDYLGWKARAGYLHPKINGAQVTPAQRATLKYGAVLDN